MPKNNSQTSVLDKLEEEMSQQGQGTTQPGQETSQQPGTTQPEQEQTGMNEPYVPDKSEKHLYHVLLEKPYYSKKTGKKISTPYIQKFTESEYNSLTSKKSESDKSNAEMLGYEVTVLWNPKENI